MALHDFSGPRRQETEIGRNPRQLDLAQIARFIPDGSSATCPRSAWYSVPQGRTRESGRTSFDTEGLLGQFLSIDLADRTVTRIGELEDLSSSVAFITAE
jgi:hypothetical protein